MPKFSIRGLLAVTALVALSLSIWQAEHRIRQASDAYAEMQDLQLATQVLIDEESRYVEHYERVEAEFAEHQQRMKQAETEFASLAEKYGELAVKDSANLAIVDYPRARDEEQVKFTWRVHVPQDSQWDLLCRFQDETSKSIPESSILSPGQPSTHPIPKGRHEMEFTFQKETGVIQFRLNDELMVEQKYAGKWSLGYGKTNYKDPYQPRGRTLLELIDFWPGKDPVKESVVFSLRRRDDE